MVWIRLTFLASLLFASVGQAAERATVCAKYEKQYGWSQGYSVEARILKGSELNRATTSYDYNALSTYVVIFWDQNEASVIEMSFPTLSTVGTRGTDQRGRDWQIAKTSFCY